MVEAVLFISVALALIAGGLSVHQQATLSEPAASQMRVQHRLARGRDAADAGSTG
jgi:hypothetical protein